MKILVYLIYPIATLWLATKAPIVSENLTYIANQLGYRWAFISWSISTVVLLAILLIPIVNKSIHKKRIQSIFFVSAICYTTATLLPYDINAGIGSAHVTLSFVGMIGLLLGIICLAQSLSFNQTLSVFQKYGAILIGGIALAIYLQRGSINSLVEIFLAISLPIYLLELGKEIK